MPAMWRAHGDKQQGTNMKLKLTDIELYEGTQVRQSSNDDTVATYAERMMANDEFPPIVIFTDGTVNYLADGFHRVLASERCKFIDIEADVRNGTKQDALWYALGANKVNALQMTQGDKRKAVAMALREWPDKTQQAIADQVGCSQPFVHKVKEQFITSNKLETPDTVTGKDGKEYPTRKPHKKDTLEDIEPETETQQEDMPDETGEEEQSEYKNPMPTRKANSNPRMGIHFAELAILDLEKIDKNDELKNEALNKVEMWINENR